MKKILILIIFLLHLIGSTFPQEECGTIEPKTGGNIPLAYLFVPRSNDPIKYIRVNIHILLREKSNPDYPGNFTKLDDGRGNADYTGYDFAEELISISNSRLSYNYQMNLPPGNSTEVLDKKYKYVLNAVLFHEDDSKYIYTRSPTSMTSYFGINVSECINVFFQGYNSSYGEGGAAVLSGNRAVVMNGAWDKGTGMWVLAGTLNHEIGHCLSLQHTLIPNRPDGTGGTCNGEDWCSDTPTNSELILYGIDPCNECERWNTGGIPTCPNNQMGYSGSSAMTPLQLGRVHWTLINEMAETSPDYSDGSVVNLTNSSEDESIIAGSVIVPSSSSITIANDKTLYVRSDEFIVNGSFQVEKGSIIDIKPLGE